MRTLRSAIAILLIVTTTSCVVASRRVDINNLDYRKPVDVSSPVKAHLKDGSTIVYPAGVTVTATELQGSGTRYPFAGASASQAGRIPLDQVVAMESYRETKQFEFAPSLLATAAGVFATALLAVALFGS